MGFRRPISFEDLWALPPHLTCKNILPRIQKILNLKRGEGSDSGKGQGRRRMTRESNEEGTDFKEDKRNKNGFLEMEFKAKRPVVSKIFYCFLFKGAIPLIRETFFFFFFFGGGGGGGVAKL
jgi:hypothetical protein